ncbi:MAG: hypothetical protein M0O99_02190 [Desulfuromonas thiophila]|jgi:hypothetical protein|nr:hypothetical protein [Desulfuromonas thiophila]
MSYRVYLSGEQSESGPIKYIVERDSFDQAETLNWHVKIRNYKDSNNLSASVYDFDGAVVPSGQVVFEAGQKEAAFFIVPHDDDLLEISPEMFSIYVDGIEGSIPVSIYDDERASFDVGNLEINKPIYVHPGVTDRLKFEVYLEEGNEYEFLLKALPDQAYFYGTFSVVDPSLNVIDNFVASNDPALQFVAEETGTYTLTLRNGMNHGRMIFGVLSNDSTYSFDQAQSFLQSYNMSVAEARAVFQQYQDDPEYILQIGTDLGFSLEVLAGIADMSMSEVHAYFSRAGVSYEALLRPAVTPEPVVPTEEEINRLFAIDALEPFGLTIGDAMAFIEQNIENPQQIVNVCDEFDLSTQVLAGIVGVKTALVHEFFDGAGISYDAII